jgi:membrane protease subunit HflC
MKKGNIIIIVIAVLALILLNSSFYIVNEAEVAVVSKFGEMTAVVVDEADVDSVAANLALNDMTSIKIIDQKGLHFKIPFIYSVKTYDAKYLTYKSLEETINTKDSRRIEIQMYAQYRIIDPVIYTMAVGTKSEASKRMDEIVYPVVIQSANNLEFNEFFYQETLEDILDSKQEILNEKLGKEFGIYVSDIGINKKVFPDSNVESIESKMTLEIGKESEKLIAEGDSEYLQAKAIADREKAEIVATAVEDAAVIKAEADADAIRIYQESLGKDLEFYQFIKRMEIYKEMKDITIFIDADNDIFEYLNGY